MSKKEFVTKVWKMLGILLLVVVMLTGFVLRFSTVAPQASAAPVHTHIVVVPLGSCPPTPC